MVAAHQGHTEAVRTLLAVGADPDLRRGSDTVCGTGETALIDAAREGHVEAVRLLIDANANQEAGCQFGTALVVAVVFQQPAVLAVLLDAGADPTKSDAEGQTALVLALQHKKKNARAVQLLKAAWRGVRGGHVG